MEDIDAWAHTVLMGALIIIELVKLTINRDNGKK
jgi:hypothetical protein